MGLRKEKNKKYIEDGAIEELVLVSYRNDILCI